jgi:hypothetical protein
MGWLGTVGSISAYVLLTRGRWQATSLRYSGLNAAAGLVSGTASAVYGAWPSVGSNLLWAAIALHSVATTLLQRRRAARLAPRPVVVEPAGAAVTSDPEPPTGPQPVVLAAA